MSKIGLYITMSSKNMWIVHLDLMVHFISHPRKNVFHKIIWLTNHVSQ